MSERRGAFNPRLVVGVGLVFVGVLFALEEVGWADARQYLRFWPLLLVAFGLAKILQPAGACGRGFGAFLVVVGGFLLLDTLDLLRFDWSLVFPLALVFIGASLVWQSFLREPLRAQSGGSAPHVRAVAVLGGVDQKAASTPFSGGRATAVLGSCKLDLRDAAPLGESSVLDVFALWGGIEVRVPRDWAVELRGIPILGGFEDLSQPPAAAAAHRLSVRGMALMGGVEIRN